MPVALLFTGHMVDLPNRPAPRFPQALVPAARGALGERLDPYQGGNGVKGYASLARGGDILFHEECRRRGIPTFVVLPFAPEEFAGTSVEGVPASDWLARFQAIWEATPPADREVLGLPISDAAYKACNDRMLEIASEYGRIHLIALWDGKRGDGRGGTAHFIDEVKDRAADAEISVIATTQLVRTD